MAPRGFAAAALIVLSGCLQTSDSVDENGCPTCPFWTSDGERFEYVKYAVGHAIESDGVVNVGEGSFNFYGWTHEMGYGWWDELTWVGRGASKTEIAFAGSACGVDLGFSGPLISFVDLSIRADPRVTTCPYDNDIPFSDTSPIGPGLGVVGNVSFERVDFVGQTVAWGVLRIGQPGASPVDARVKATDCRFLSNVGVEPGPYSGIAGEQTPGGVVMIGKGLLFESVNSDWGSGESDNAPAGDVTFVDSENQRGTEYIVRRYSWDGLASFVCDSTDAVCTE